MKSNTSAFRWTFWAWLILIAQTVFLVWAALHRLIARDEGFYVYAAQLVMQGQVPYVDFFYPQMPLLPYIYGAWMALTGFDWIQARVFSGVLSALLGAVIFLYCRQKTNTLFACIGVVLYACSSFVFPWFSTAQTYVLSVLLLFIALYVSEYPKRWSIGTRFFLCGVFLGLAIDVRLFFGGLVPLFLLFILFDRDGRSRLKPLICFLAGLALALLPNLYYLISSFDLYYFNNLGYHLIRSNLGEETLLNRKWKIFRVLTGVIVSRKFDAFQYPFLLFGSGLYLIFYSWRKAGANKALLIGLAIFGLNFVPSPAYVQYFSTTVPFLIIPLVVLSYRLTQGGRGYEFIRRVTAAVLVSCLIIYLAYVPQDVVRYTQSGEGVIGIGSSKNAVEWKLDRIVEIADKINEMTTSQEEVITLWPGYVFGSQARIMAGLENHFGLPVSRKVQEPDLKRFRLITRKELITTIRAGKTNIIVLTNQVYLPRWKFALSKGGYRLAYRNGGVRVFRKKH